MTSTRNTERRPTRSALLRPALFLAAAVVLSVALNFLVASLGFRFGAAENYPPLQFPGYASFTVIGVIVGWIGWRFIQRRAANPGRVLWILVPLFTVLSMVPNVALLILQFIPGTTTAAVVALMAMHVVVVAVAVPAYILASRR